MPAATTWTWSQVLARRLRRHRLVDGAPGVPDGSAPDSASSALVADVSSAVCGVHAQVMTAAEVSVGVRAPGTTRRHVQAALWDDREVVKTYGPRGTVHLIAARDLATWCGALAAVPWSSPLPEGVRLTAEQTDQVVEAVRGALADDPGDGLTVDELGVQVADRLGPWAGELVMPAFQTMWPRWRQAVGRCASRGALCFGAPRGRQVTFTDPQRWVPGFAPLDRGPALTGAVRAYLRAYGPAEPAHLAQWLAAPRGWTAQALEQVEGLREVSVDGRAGWVVEGDEVPDDDPPAGLRLLPYFDAYGVGCQPRSQVFPGEMAQRALNRGQAGNFAVVLLDGVVHGVWHQRASGKRLLVTVEPRRRLTAAQRRALDEQVARVGAVRELAAELVVGTVTTGGHA
ncbi:winged helix DNA-binding domain-containing protein [Angustibacter peucedani]